MCSNCKELDQRTRQHTVSHVPLTFPANRCVQGRNTCTVFSIPEKQHIWRMKYIDKVQSLSSGSLLSPLGQVKAYILLAFWKAETHKDLTRGQCDARIHSPRLAQRGCSCADVEFLSTTNQKIWQQHLNMYSSTCCADSKKRNNNTFTNGFLASVHTFWVNKPHCYFEFYHARLERTI